MTRQERLDYIRNNPNIPVLIVGGGVNGIGTFRDLALQGVDVLLVEQGDFCSGTSAASSHMMHGGLRYLENGEFRLVREALHERNRLLQNAPHYVHPLPTTIPIFRWMSGWWNAPLKFLGLLDRPSERGALVIKIGLSVYDWFTRDSQTMPAHRFQGREASLRQRPHLNPDIICTATYYDAWTPVPERLCMEMILDAEAAHAGARAINYLAAVDASQGEVILRDESTGETFSVKPQILINAAGPWIDRVNARLGQNTKYIGGTKGSHLVLDHPDLLAACDGHEIFFENNDGRITLFFPLGDRVLAGTTDIPVDTPDSVCTDEEIDYILTAIRHVFPGIAVDRSHIVFTFSGVRPLPSSDAATAGQISRDHSIREVKGLGFPAYSLVGGKWTTFRAFSEEAADLVLSQLKQTRRGFTRAEPIGGGRDYPFLAVDQERWLRDLQHETELEMEQLRDLFERYGTYAREVARFVAEGQDAALSHSHNHSKREVLFLAQQEQVQHLDDLVLRRTLLGMSGRVSAALLDELAAVLAEALGWSPEQRGREVERAVRVLNERHGLSLNAESVSAD